MNIFEEKQLKPQLNALESYLDTDRQQAEAMLGTVKRHFGEDADLYKKLVEVSAEIRAAASVRKVIDGGISYNKRLDHFKHAYQTARHILDMVRTETKVSIQGLDEMVNDTGDKMFRWLDGVDETLRPFFDEAEQHARHLLRVHYLLTLGNRPDEAVRYKELADEIERLSWARTNTDYMHVDERIPQLKVEARNLDLSKHEVELLSAAAASNGTINKLSVDAIPSGFVRVGDKTYGAEDNLPEVASYVSSLRTLIEKGFVEHISNDKLFYLTSKGWERVSMPDAAIPN